MSQSLGLEVISIWNYAKILLWKIYNDFNREIVENLNVLFTCNVKYWYLDYPYKMNT